MSNSIIDQHRDERDFIFKNDIELSVNGQRMRLDWLMFKAEQIWMYTRMIRNSDEEFERRLKEEGLWDAWKERSAQEHRKRILDRLAGTKTIADHIGYH